MKTFQFITITFLLFSSSCSSSKFSLVGKEFSTSDKSTKGESLNFINDSLCFYTQTFYCDIPERYRITDIKCRYTINGDIISLKRISCPEYLENQSCYILSIDCAPMPVDTIEHRLIIGAPPKIDKIGLINNINVEEDFLYYKGCIYYAKALSCLPKEITGSSFQIFCKGGEKQAVKKVRILKRLTKQRRIPINDLEIALSR